MTDDVPGRDDGLIEDVIILVRRIQSLPYVWPCPPDADSARRAGAGSCASKHALLAEELTSLGVDSSPLLLTGALVPAMLRNDREFTAGAGLVEVHECLTVVTPWAGPLRVDVTWDPPLIERGLSGTVQWDCRSDMALAVDDGGPGWSVSRSGLRDAKEALRARMYGPGQRKMRDEMLRRLAKRFEAWRRGEN